VAVDRAVLRAWLTASRESQGLPDQVSDALVLAQVGVLLGAGAEGTRAQGAPAPSARPPAAPSEGPVGLDALGVESVAAGNGGGLDCDVVDDGLDDRALTGEVEALPLTA
jgi:hypothetical protein